MLVGYVVEAAFYGAGRIAPAVVEVGITMVSHLCYGTYWLVWGRNEPARKEAKLRQILREELQAVLDEDKEAYLDVPPPYEKEYDSVK